MLVVSARMSMRYEYDYLRVGFAFGIGLGRGRVKKAVDGEGCVLIFDFGIAGLFIVLVCWHWLGSATWNVCITTSRCS